MRRRAASSPVSRAPAAPAHWTRRANSAPARRSRRKLGSIALRVKSLARRSNPQSLSVGWVERRGRALVRSRRETHRWVSRGLNPSYRLGVLLMAAALAWPGLAAGEELQTPVVAGDS